MDVGTPAFDSMQTPRLLDEVLATG